MNDDNPIFDFNDEVINITGRAIPELASLAWCGFLDDLKQYIKSKTRLIINFRLDYFNSSSSRYITDMFSILSEFSRQCRTTVNWYYFDGDDTTMENGEIYKERNLKIKVNLIKRDD